LQKKCAHGLLEECGVDVDNLVEVDHDFEDFDGFDVATVKIERSRIFPVILSKTVDDRLQELKLWSGDGTTHAKTGTATCGKAGETVRVAVGELLKTINIVAEEMWGTSNAVGDECSRLVAENRVPNCWQSLEEKIENSTK
jgi:hypothetical protein